MKKSAALTALLGSVGCGNNDKAGASLASSTSGCEDWQFVADTNEMGGTCFRHLVVTNKSAAGLQAFGSTNVTMAFFTSPDGSLDPRAPIPANTRVCANKRLVAPATLSKDYQARLVSYIEGGKKDLENDSFAKSELNGWLPGFWEAFQKLLGSTPVTNMSLSNIGMIFSVSPMGLRNSSGSYEVWTAAYVPKSDCYLMLSSMKSPPYSHMIKTERPLSY